LPRGARWWAGGALTVAALLAVWWNVPPWIRGPAPYPPDWLWGLRGEATSSRFALALGSAAGLAAVLWASGTLWVVERRGFAARVLLVAAGVLGFAFSLGLLDLERAGAFPTLAARAMSTTWSSYYTVAVSKDAQDPRDFLDRHAELLPHLPKHAATHPPGPVLYYRGLIALCDASPRLTARLLALEDQDDEREPRPPNTRASKAAALLGALLLMLLGMAAAWPISAMATRIGGNPLAGARAGTLWTLVPGAALFVPQFDQALALPVAATAALLLAAAEAPRGGARTARSIAAGLTAGVALFFSYGSAAFLAIAGVAVLARVGLTRRSLTAAAVACVATVAVFFAPVLLGHEPLAAARTALAIHREAYTSARRYWLWLPFNLLDLTLFAGPPAVALLLARCRESRFAQALAAGIGLLLLSGATRGEVGRLWIPVMTLLLVAAVTRPAGDRTSPPAGDGSPSRAEALLLAALLAALDCVLRIRWDL